MAPGRFVRLVAGLTFVVVVITAAASGPGALWVVRNDERHEAVDPASASVDTEPVRIREATDVGGDFGDIVASILVAALVLFAVVAWPRVPRDAVAERWLRFARGRGGVVLPSSHDDRHPKSNAHGPGDSEPHSESARNAVIVCWMRLERHAGASGVPRLESETSAEFSERVVTSLGLESQGVLELAQLYREARFSTHPCGESKGRRASKLVDAVVGELKSVRGGAA